MLGVSYLHGCMCTLGALLSLWHSIDVLTLFLPQWCSIDKDSLDFLTQQLNTIDIMASAASKSPIPFDSVGQCHVRLAEPGVRQKKLFRPAG